MVHARIPPDQYSTDLWFAPDWRRPGDQHCCGRRLRQFGKCHQEHHYGANFDSDPGADFVIDDNTDRANPSVRRESERESLLKRAGPFRDASIALGALPSHMSDTGWDPHVRRHRLA
jgi:hypothetical protein